MNLIRALVRAASIRTVSLALLGAMLGGVSAVAVFKRIGPACVQCLRELFAQLATTAEPCAALAGAFQRVLVQDSSVFGLPVSCAGKYRGAANQNGSRPQARLQCVLDLLRGGVVWARYDDFRRNDQRSATADLLDFARPGDLVVRDRGYSTVKALATALAAGIALLTRLRFGTGLYVQQGLHIKAFNLRKHLRAGQLLDCQVLVGEALVPMRLVCLPLSREHAAQRRRQARQDRDKRLRHSREYYRQLGWAIFLTSVPREQLGAEQIGTLYRLRWRIEIVFKAAKSHVWARELPVRASVSLVECLMWARLLALWLQLREFSLLQADQPLSLLRHAALFALRLAQLLPLPPLSREATLRIITQARRKRPSFHAFFEQLFAPSAELS